MNTRISIRTAIASTALIGLCLASSSVLAFEPERPKCVAPANPGGGHDLTCRNGARALEETGIIDGPMAVTHMPGGSGAVAFASVQSNQRADNNLLVAASTGTLLNLAVRQYGADFDETDVRWVATLGADYGTIVVRPDAPWDTLDDLVAAYKEDPGSIVVGGGSTPGGQDWMKMALLLQDAEIPLEDFRFVAYEGGGEALAGLLGETINVFPADVGEMQQHVEAGTVKVLGVLSTERLPEPYADVPTAQEQGYDVDWTILRGYYMGPDVTDEAYEFWVSGFEQMYDDPKFQAIVDQAGLFPLHLSGEELEASVRDRVERLRTIAISAGLIDG